MNFRPQGDRAGINSQRILVVNAGSSSCKVRLIDPISGETSATAVVERVGCPDTTYHVVVGGHDASGVTAVRDVADALDLIVRQFSGIGLSLATDPPAAIGHRVVHGGALITRPVLINDDVLAATEAASPLAPLHNPASLAGIHAALRTFPGLPQVAVFDTAFFAALPKAASTYAIDRAVAAQFGIRRFGFHGISHEFVSGEAARIVGREISDVRQIVLHLGNGASVSAIDRGRPVDTSMGMTPLEGLVTGTRGGDVDPGVLLHLLRTGRYDGDDLAQLLTRQSGLLGLAGHEDMRDVVTAANRGDEAAQLALDVMAHRLRKYVGAYLAVLGGLDVLTFTAGVGENSPQVRAMALDGLDHLGISLDRTRNAANSQQERVVSTEGSPVTVLVVPTDEELPIARQTLAVLSGNCHWQGPV